MKVLVTGGAGYKGIQLTKELLKKGFDVTILDNFLYGYDSVLNLLNEEKLTVIKEDVRNLRESDLTNYDVIFHLAGISGYPACEANPSSAHLINVEATKKIVESLSTQQLLIYASTTSFYGKSGTECTEDVAVNPVSLYGITKFHAEQFVLQRENSIALRFATVFGVSPRMRIDLLINDFVYKAVNERSIVLFESKSKRTFIHIEDAIKAYMFALENNIQMKGNIYNVGDSELNFSKLEISKRISEYTNCKIIDSDLSDYDKRDFNVSFRKINNLGYKTQKSLDDGIKELLKLYEFYKPFLPYRII